MQKTNFPIEILIHDDASTDKSADIIREYVERYPHIQWRPIYQTENQYSQGKRVDLNLLPKVRGKYVAFCEGDDYWTDPLKLQKQVDFLEANPDFSICYHSARMTWEDGEQPEHIFPRDLKPSQSGIMELKTIAEGTQYATNSVVYRWCFNQTDYRFEEHFPENIFPGDLMMDLCHAMRGKAKQLPGCMSVYRRHSGGVWFNAELSDSFFIKSYKHLINFYIQAERITGLNFSVQRRAMIEDCILASMTTGNGELLNELKQSHPEDFDIITRHYTKAARIAAAKSLLSTTVRTVPFMPFVKKKILNYLKINEK